MQERAQASMEAILIVGMFILLLVSVSIPNIFKARNAAGDVQVATDARYAVEQIAGAANSIMNTYEKRTIEVYIPGATSTGNSSNGLPLISRVVCISTDGDFLNMTVRLRRYDANSNLLQLEYVNFSRDLSGTGWKTYAKNGSVYSQIPLSENKGKRYTIIVSSKNITSNTQPGVVASSCSGAF